MREGHELACCQADLVTDSCRQKQHNHYGSRSANLKCNYALYITFKEEPKSYAED